MGKILDLIKDIIETQDAKKNKVKGMYFNVNTFLNFTEEMVDLGFDRKDVRCDFYKILDNKIFWFRMMFIDDKLKDGELKFRVEYEPNYISFFVNLEEANYSLNIIG